MGQVVGRKHGYVIDAEHFGALLKGARISARIETREDLCARLAADFGIEVSQAVIGSYERGRTIPPLEMFFLLVLILRPANGIRYFAPAVNDEIIEKVLALDSTLIRGVHH